MRNRNKLIKCLALMMLMASVAVAAAPDPATVQITGTLGLSEALEHSCLAVWVPVGADAALGGIRWYNNDGTVAFPAVLVQSGAPEYPVSLTDAFEVAQQVTGVSSGWSALTFSEPVAALGAGLYVILQVPAGAVATSEGAGGGPALGYTGAAAGLPGWLSADGEDWVKVQPSHGFAVIPQFVPRTDGMATKSAHRGDDDGAGTATAAALATVLEPAAPNPFNPQATLRFSLAQDGPVELAIYNLRGERVRTLLSGPMAPGAYERVWDGRDEQGTAQASGVYVARLHTLQVTATQRLTLIR